MIIIMIFVGSGAIREWADSKTWMYVFAITAGFLLLYWVIDAATRRRR